MSGAPEVRTGAPSPVELEAVSIEAVRAAGALIGANRRRTIGVIDAKSSPTDVVTQTDLDAEHLIRSIILAATPHATVLGEEGGTATATGGASRLQWVVDPLDGTVNFLYGLPVVAVSVAAALDGEIVAGAVADVQSGEVFSTATGTGARLDGSPVAVSACDDPSQALVTTGFSYHAHLRAQQGEVVQRVLPAVRDIRCFGSAALQLCWVGAGRVDAYFERDIKVWDHAAGSLIAAEGGADVELACPENDGLVMAATPAIVVALRPLLGRGRA